MRDFDEDNERTCEGSHPAPSSVHTSGGVAAGGNGVPWPSGAVT